MLMRSIAKYLCFVLSLLIVLTVMIGCQKSLSEQTNHPIESLSPDTTDYGPLIDLSYYQIIEWNHYRTAQEIVNAATNIFEGKVIDISFDVFNIKTGQIDHSPESGKADRLLYTLYTIEVQNEYKGSSTSPITIKMVGGIDSRIEEQEELCRETGILRTIINGGTKELTIGESYLFCTHRYPPYDAIINMEQFSFPLDSADADAIRQACAELK